jgi:hypothetical protein
MKRTKRLLIAAVAVGLVLAMTATTVAAFSFVKLKAVDYSFKFQFGNCTVVTTEYQTEHWVWFLGKDRHFLSTIIGIVNASGDCTIPGVGFTLPAEVPFAAIDVFNPLGDKFSIKSHGMAVVLEPPMRVGVNAWRVQKSPPAWCGYAYLYKGDNKFDYLIAPFKGTLLPDGTFSIVPGSCLDATPPLQ